MENQSSYKSLSESSVIAPFLVLDPENFGREVYQSRIPTIVLFYRPGCGDCQNMRPIYHEMALEFSGRGVGFGEFNTDVEGGRSFIKTEGFGVELYGDEFYTPTWIRFDGKEKTNMLPSPEDRAMTREDLSQWLEPQLPKATQ